MIQNKDRFWQSIAHLVDAFELVIDRPRGSTHPRYQALIYPNDYGYLQGTQAGDGQGIDVWRGAEGEAGVSGVVCCVDQEKGDAEMKIMVNCSENEMSEIESFHNAGRQTAIIIAIPRT